MTLSHMRSTSWRPSNSSWARRWPMRLPDVSGRIPASIQRWAHGENQHGMARIDREIERCEEAGLSRTEYRQPTLADRALYIYTSGTTGLPKAVNVSHFRLMQWSHWFAGMMDTRPDDRIYNCLPMYHSVGGVTAIGAALVNGGSVMIRKRFSASRFWDEVVESKCTIFAVHRRTLPLPGEHAAASARNAASAKTRMRQWNGCRRMGGIPDPIPNSADPRVLRSDGR